MKVAVSSSISTFVEALTGMKIDTSEDVVCDGICRTIVSIGSPIPLGLGVIVELTESLMNLAAHDRVKE